MPLGSQSHAWPAGLTPVHAPAQVTLSELKDYMVHLRSMPNISRHATLAEMVKRFMVQPSFVARVHAEQDLLSGAGPDACCDFIEVGSASHCGHGLPGMPRRGCCCVREQRLAATWLRVGLACVPPDTCTLLPVPETPATSALRSTVVGPPLHFL